MSEQPPQLPAMKVPRGVVLGNLHGHLRAALPAISFALVLGAIAFLNPRVISYFGFSLMLIYAVPILLATLAQMFAMTCNDIDLSIGTFVGFVCCVVATYLYDTPVLGIIILAGCIGLYALLGALIHLRNLPSIVVTLGMSFVWQGLAILLMPKPGGKAPDWLQAIMGWKPPFIPLPIVAACLAAAIVWYGLMQTSYGAILRGTGGNPKAVSRAGWSILKVKMVLYAFVGLFGVFSGMALVGITRSADAHLGDGYTLLSIASVILGGGEFVGGIVSPVGAVLGALTLTLASTQLLGFLRIPPDWQVGANGAILVIVLAARVLLSRKGRKS
jgi:ribose transport system permease protein